MAPEEPAFSDSLPPAQTPPSDPRFFLSAAATFLLLLVLAEGVSRWALGSGLFYRRFDFTGTLTSRPELEDRIRLAVASHAAVFLLGDSVLGPTALLERGVADARGKSLSACLRRLESSRGRQVESLAADGMLIPDLEGVGRLLERSPPGEVLVLLNFRMFSAAFQMPEQAVSRDFLRAGLPLPLAPDARASRALEDRLADWSLAHSMLFRTTSQLKTLWYYPSRRDFYRRWIERILGPDGDAELQDSVLRLKVAPFYASAWEASALSFRSLDRLLGTLGRAKAVVVLSPQNPDFVGDAATFRDNRALLAGFMEAHKSAGLEYEDWADRFAAGRFVDHCHLTAEGNRELARDLGGLLEP